MNISKTLTVLLTALLWVGTTARAGARWEGTWATAPEFTGPGDMPKTTLAGRAVRQIIQVSMGGETLRMQLSNHFGDSPVDIAAVYIAPVTQAPAIDARAARYLSFAHKRSVTIAAGADLYSDALKYALKAGQRLAVTVVYGKQVPQHATSHRGSRTTSYIVAGKGLPKADFSKGERVDHWYNITRLEVLAEEPHEVVAVLGNSITDGRGSTTNAQNRWTDFMAKALNSNGKTTGVLNLGIGGNCVVSGGLSEPAVKRFDRDILSQSHIDKLIIFEGTNDIGCCGGNYEAKARDIINAYKALIAKAHAKGIKVYGGTITPTKGNAWFSFFHEAMRQTVNEWIRKPGNFDGVVDFDQLVRDAADHERLNADYSDDWLHLNPKGYEAMGAFAAKCINP